MVTLPQDIVEKLGLSLSNMNTGTSFVSDIPFYEWPEYGYIARCDPNGEPIPEGQAGLFFTEIKKGYARCTIEALRYVPIDILIKSIISNDGE
jgi:hypothetical protein